MTDVSIPARPRVKREPVFQGKERVPGLWVRESANGPVYEVQKRVDGKMRRLKLRARMKTDAVNEARGLSVDIDRGDVEIGDRSVTVALLAASFLDREEGALGTLGDRTVELYRQRLTNHVVPALGANTRAADVRVQHLRRMVDTLKRRGLSGSTVRGCVAATSAVFRHGVRNVGCVTRNSVRDLDRGDLPSGKRQSKPR